MPATLILAYPRGSNVDLTYYIDKHLPIALPALKRAGLMSWRVSKAAPGRDGQPASHEVFVFLEFEGAEQIARIAAPENAEANKAAAADLPNYSRLPPVSWVVEETASAKL
ncbi:hypothetical protein DL770_003762 [Monosporascus sp. CRB-9-2]|nr:hypothetical protein DL770_003762 [Monosporascus sp. CRB-9-2]